MRVWILFLVGAALAAAELVVGPGRGFTRIEDALAAAREGDVIIIRPRPDGKPWSGIAIRLTLPGITVRGVGEKARPILDGTGFDYSGAGNVPRAIIEIGPEAHGCRVEGLAFTGARNATGNAAGVRIDRADQVLVSDCEFSANDMGLMSGGNAREARGQRIERCHFHGNGAPDGKGQSHNLYLGGADARLVGNLIEDASDGHDLKSRTAKLLVEACILRGAANRELDIVDAAGTTDQAGSTAMILGCVIAKRADCPGNRTLIHFGQDGGVDRKGTLHLVHCTLVTPFLTPVIQLSAPSARATISNSVVVDPTGGGAGRVLVQRVGNGPATFDWAGGLWLSYGFPAPEGAKQVTVAAYNEFPPLRDLATLDCRLLPDATGPVIDGGLALEQLPLPFAALASEHPLRQRPPMLLEATDGPAALARSMIGAPDLGAFERSPPP